MTEVEKPPEASLYDDPATADLAAKVAEAWAEFDRALAEVLPTLPAGATLDITLDPTASGVGEAVYAVSVTPAADSMLKAYAVGNSLLPPEHRLTRSAVAALVALGWSPPRGGDEDERFTVELSTAQSARLAAIVSRTLKDVYGTPHPAFLVYDASTEAGDDAPAASDAKPRPGRSAVELAPLGAARPEHGEAIRPPERHDLSGLSLPDKVAAVIAAMLKTTPDKLPVDSEGDIGIRSGSAMVFVRVRDNPPLVDVFSPVLTEVDTNERLYAKLSELTHRMPIGRLYCAGQTVWASVPVFGRDFQPTHLMLAVQVMTGLADELDDRLHGEFGGKRFFVEGDRAPDKPEKPEEGDAQTGMYL